MVQYIYTDDVTESLDPTQTLVYDLLKCGEKFGLTRLVQLCKVATFIARAGIIEDSSSSSSSSSSSEEEEDGGEDKQKQTNQEERQRKKIKRKQQRLLQKRQQFNKDGYSNLEVPRSTLSIDYSGALGESEFADIRFIAGKSNNKGIYAHRCILTARSTYFNAMFRMSGAMNEEEEEGEDDASSRSSGSSRRRRRRKKIVDIVVPDSYVGLLRLLLYVYSGALADSNTDALLEDLVAADRYQLRDMKKLCESMIVVTPENAASVLDVAIGAGGVRLRKEVRRGERKKYSASEAAEEDENTSE